MTAADVLNRATANLVNLHVANGKLKYSGPPDAVRALLPELKALKLELLALLAANQEPPVVIVEPDPDALADDFEERAAIIEEGDKVSRLAAERRAWELVYCRSCQQFALNTIDA